VELFGSGNQALVVAAAGEDPDYRDGLVQHGVGDDDAFPVPDRAQPRTEVVASYSSVGEIGEAFAKSDDRLREGCSVAGEPASAMKSKSSSSCSRARAGIRHGSASLRI
jgi:hypothetical protein